MNNIQRLATFIAEHGAGSILIHSVPRSQGWLVSQIIGKNSWNLMLMNPGGNIIYNLGVVDKENLDDLWTDLTIMEIQDRASYVRRAKKYKERIAYFLKRHEKKEIYLNWRKSLINK